MRINIGRLSRSLNSLGAALSLVALLLSYASAAKNAPSALGSLLELAAWEPLPAPPVSRKVAAMESSPLDFSCLFDGRTGSPVSSRAAMERILASQVVHVGEKHDDRLHHEVQRFILEAVHAAGSAAGAFEMLHAAHQEALDRYLRGGSEGTFLTEVDWPKTWGFPFELYRPLFMTLRENRLEGIALNVPKAIVHKVAREGFESLSEEERRSVPAGMSRTADAPYLAMLRETFLQHGGDPQDARAFGRYLDAMTLWNEGMASRVAGYAASHPGTKVVVFAGMFHAYDAGIPESVRRRLPGIAQTGVILTEADSCPSALPPGSLSLSSDLVWVMTRARRF